MEQAKTQHTVTVRGAKVVVTEMGAGMPVLLLHGSPDTWEMWAPLMERLAPHVRVIAPDLPGFGASTMPKGFDLSLDGFAEVICDLLLKLNISEPVVMIGTDFGGHFGLAFATKYPERVRGIGITNTTFFREYQWHSFAKLYRIPLVGEVLTAGTKTTMNKALKHFAPHLPDSYLDKSYALGFGNPSVRKAILRLYRERNPEHFIGWDEKLAAVIKQKPTIVLWGDKDPFVTPDFADKFGAAQVHHFAEYSHWLPLEAPDQYAEKLIPWLEGLEIRD